MLTGLVDVTDDLVGWTATALGRGPALRRDRRLRPLRQRSRPARRGQDRPGSGSGPSSWTSWLDEDAFTDGVRTHPRRDRRGRRVPGEPDTAALGARCPGRRRRRRPRCGPRRGQPGAVPRGGPPARPRIHVASAITRAVPRTRRRPDLVLAHQGHRRHGDGFLDKDRAENVMIVDLVRNDLGRVCEWGSARCRRCSRSRQHPGLFHLVRTVAGRLREGGGWAGAIGATFPPGRSPAPRRSPRWSGSPS